MNGETSVRIHFIDSESGKNIARTTECHVPRIGDEVRLSNDRFFAVVHIVWAYDELNTPYGRVNIGLKKIDDENT